MPFKNRFLVIFGGAVPFPTPFLTSSLTIIRTGPWGQVLWVVLQQKPISSKKPLGGLGGTQLLLFCLLCTLELFLLLCLNVVLHLPSFSLLFFCRKATSHRVKQLFDLQLKDSQ